jgi:hypothetical protein
MVYFLVKVAFKIRQDPDSQQSKLVMQSFKKLAWYPVIYIVCWVLPTVVDIIGTERSDFAQGSPYFILLPNIIPIFQAPLSTLAYFNANPIVRQYWASWARQTFSYKKRTDKGIDADWSFSESHDESIIRLEDQEDYMLPRDTTASTASTVVSNPIAAASNMWNLMASRTASRADDAPSGSLFIQNSSFKGSSKITKDIELSA